MEEELKAKNTLVDMLSADRAELSKRLKNLEAGSQLQLARRNMEKDENQPFQIPKHCSRAKNVPDQPGIPTENRYSPIANSEEISFSEPPQVLQVEAQVHHTEHLRTPRQENKASSLSDPRRKVVFLSDSYGKDMFHDMTQLSQDFNFFVYAKGGAKLKQVLKAGHPMASSLTEEDFVVVAARTNDIGDYEPGNLTIMQGIDELLKWTIKAKILCVEIPYRCDMPSVNNDIFYANLAIKRMVSDYDGPSRISQVNINNSLNRSHYTRHGLHLNRKGKAVLGNIIIDEIAKTQNMTAMPPENSLDGNTKEIHLQVQPQPAVPPPSQTDLNAIELFPGFESITSDQNETKIDASPHSSTQTSPPAMSQPADVSQILLEADLFTMSMEEFPPLSGCSATRDQTSLPAHQQPHPSFLETPLQSTVVK